MICVIVGFIFFAFILIPRYAFYGKYSMNDIELLQAIFLVTSILHLD